MKFTLLLFSFLFLHPFSQPRERKVISHASFVDKIRGGWAGQYFGISFLDQQPVVASIDSFQIVDQNYDLVDATHQDKSFEANLYADLLYLSVIHEHGVDKIAKPLSERMASSNFLSGHAIQTAGYNIRGGMTAASAGRWIHNPHAEDPDFTKASDVLGLLAPGMPHTLFKMTDPIGHLTNTGEGYYGGLYVATLNALAFVYKNPGELVGHALKNLPEKSDYRKCLEDVVFQVKTHPGEWKKNWNYLSAEWRKDTGCPFNPSARESDARIYTAFATMVFLTGEGNLDKTIEVASSFPGGLQVLPTVLGLLGVMNGFERFPSDWKLRFDSVADVRFHASLPTLNEACDLSVRNAIKTIDANGGKEKPDGDIVIRVQKATSHGLERGFEGHFITKVQPINLKIDGQFEFEFEGVGFVLRADPLSDHETEDIAFAELYLNNKYIDRIAIPGNKSHLASDLCWRLQLPYKKYRAKLKLLKPESAPSLTVTSIVIYDVMPPVRISERWLR